jgi:hypothetical protein
MRVFLSPIPISVSEPTKWEAVWEYEADPISGRFSLCVLLDDIFPWLFMKSKGQLWRFLDSPVWFAQ